MNYIKDTLLYLMFNIYIKIIYISIMWTYIYILNIGMIFIYIYKINKNKSNLGKTNLHK